jgi:D-tyrosyl-tRNA(Tyr) deacylase
MRVCLQRVKSARVTVDGETIGEIGPGLVVLAGFRQGDDESAVAPMAEKVVNLRIFEDDEGRMNRSLRRRNYTCAWLTPFRVWVCRWRPDDSAPRCWWRSTTGVRSPC